MSAQPDTYRVVPADLIAPAQYWHDPLQLPLYRRVSRYLATLNNEEAAHNSSLTADLAQLEQFIMVQWEDDTFIKPKVDRYLIILITR